MGQQPFCSVVLTYREALDRALEAVHNGRSDRLLIGVAARNLGSNVRRVQQLALLVRQGRHALGHSCRLASTRQHMIMYL